MAKPKNYSRTIGVFFGSDSPEKDFSISTAVLVINELLSVGFNVVGIFIDEDGNWYINRFRTGIEDFEYVLKNIKRKNWRLHLNHHGAMLFSCPSGLTSQSIKVDMAMPVLHGVGGEDGTFQGLCQFLNVPYIGCGINTSTLAFDKVLAKDVLNSFDIKTENYVYFSQLEWRKHKNELVNSIEESLRFPLYVKPARSGGGFGISEISEVGQLPKALELAFKYDNKVLVEQAVTNPLEIKVAVMGNFFRPDQIQISDPMYLNANTNEFLPISIPQKDTNKIIKLAKQVFVTFEATGLAQVDIIKDKKTGELFVTEIDTLPYDIAIPIWEASDVSADAVIRELVRLADENLDNN